MSKGLLENIDFDLIQKHIKNYYTELLITRYGVNEEKATEAFNYIYDKVKNITNLEDVAGIIENNLDEIKKIINKTEEVAQDNLLDYKNMTDLELVGIYIKEEQERASYFLDLESMELINKHKIEIFCFQDIDNEVLDLRLNNLGNRVILDRVEHHAHMWEHIYKTVSVREGLFGLKRESVSVLNPKRYISVNYFRSEFNEKVREAIENLVITNIAIKLKISKEEVVMILTLLEEKLPIEFINRNTNCSLTREEIKRLGELYYHGIDKPRYSYSKSHPHPPMPITSCPYKDK